MKTLTNNEMIAFYNEYKSKDHNGKKSGIASLDNIIRMDKRNLAVLTAKPNQGKSTFINYYCYQMAINNNWKTLYFNFETDNGRFINDLVKLYGDIEKVIEYCHIVNVNEISSLNELFEIIHEEKKINNIDMCVIDPFMRLNAWLSEINTYTIGKVLTDLQQTAINEDILLLLIAHPTKIKEGVDINPNDIMGSTYFYTVSDFIFSLNIVDRENMMTEIRTLKIRNNLDMGLCGASCCLQFNPMTKRYDEVEDDKMDIPFAEIAAKEVMTQMAQNKATGERLNDKPYEVTIEDEQTQQSQKEKQIKPLEIDNIMVGVFRNCNTKVPREFISLKDASKLGERQRDIIEQIRIITKEKPKGWEQTKRELKSKLQCYLPSIKSRNRRVENDTIYNNIICFDIDEKDNIDYTYNELMEVLKHDEHTLYIGASCSGNGVYGYFVGDGSINDYDAQFEAMRNYLNTKYEISIDRSAKDITRLRFASFDDNDYWNLFAKPFTEKAIINRTTCNVLKRDCQSGTQENKINSNNHQNKLFESEKEWLENTIEEIKKENLILTKNHNESNAIGCDIAYYFGYDGLDYYLTIRKQRKENYIKKNSIDKYYNICKWVESSDYVREGYLQTLKHFYYRAIKEKQEAQNNIFSCGVFKRK